MITKLICGNAADVLLDISDDHFDAIITSPPYGDLRDYDSFSFPFKRIARQLYRVTAEGGVLVWVVNDKIIKGNRSMVSFKQALYFQELGYNVHDVMIYRKNGSPFIRSNAYTPVWEFMLVFSKGPPKTFNRLTERVKDVRKRNTATLRHKDGTISKDVGWRGSMLKARENIWKFATGLNGTTKDRIAFKHPAMFPEKLAEDHILSWTNKGDTVLDPFCGAGTTLKMAALNERNSYGIEISEKYCGIIRERLERYNITID